MTLCVTDQRFISAVLISLLVCNFLEGVYGNRYQTEPSPFFIILFWKKDFFSEKQHSLLSLTEEGNSLHILRYCKDCAWAAFMKKVGSWGVIQRFSHKPIFSWTASRFTKISRNISVLWTKSWRWSHLALWGKTGRMLRTMVSLLSDLTAGNAKTWTITLWETPSIVSMTCCSYSGCFEKQNLCVDLT